MKRFLFWVEDQIVEVGEQAKPLIVFLGFVFLAMAFLAGLGGVPVQSVSAAEGFEERQARALEQSVRAQEKIAEELAELRRAVERCEK